jgi:hypothetical protein
MTLLNSEGGAEVSWLDLIHYVTVTLHLTNGTASLSVRAYEQLQGLYGLPCNTPSSSVPALFMHIR